MPDVEILQAEIEAEKSWRLEEIRFFKNRGAELPSPEADTYRRAMVVLLYSHFEGFCKFAFSHYAKAINDEQINCCDASPEVAALGMAKIFAELRNPQKKSPEWKHVLPDDPKLYRLARDREFLSRFEELAKAKVTISDDAIDVESNLKPLVLRKNLFALGLNPMQFEEIETDIGHLVGLRNNIAHGSLRGGVAEQKYQKYEAAAFHVIDMIGRGIMEAITERKFARSGSSATSGTGEVAVNQGA